MIVPGTRVVLGMPFLRHIKTQVDFRNGWMDVNHHPIQLYTKATTKPSVNYIESLESEGHLIRDSQLSLLRLKLTKLTDPTVKGRLEEILFKYRDIWWDDSKGRTHVIKHPINTYTSRAISCRPRKYAEDQQRIIDEEVTKMLNDGVIRPSNSPYASAVVLVRKKDDTWRFCIDYRPLNKITIKDEHPLPRIKDLLYSVKNSRYFVALDLKAGYWQIAMEEVDIPKTAFRTSRGLYEFTVMPFGLVNAPATFQRMVENLFGKYRWDGILVYLDDILIHGPTIERVFYLLDVVFTTLSDAGLTINFKKSEFFPTTINYLGHTIDMHGMRPNSNRVQALQELQPPKDVPGVRRLLGLFGYYREYIPNYSFITEPMTRLLKKDTKFVWDDEQQQALLQLQGPLRDAVLTIPLDTDDFLLETDASGVAVAAILSVFRENRWQPVECQSHTLNDTQRNWPIREKEAYAIIWALRKFDDFLRGRSFTVHTDHKSLEWLKEAQKGKLARWGQLLEEYNMTLYYKKGSEMQHVDTFTRNPYEEDPIEDRMLYTIEAAPFTHPKLPTMDMIKAETIREYGHNPSFGRKEDGLIYHGRRIWLPANLRSPILDCLHTRLEHHHLGVRKTYMIIKQLFYWPKMLRDIQHYIKSCLVCQRITYTNRASNQGLFRGHPLAAPFATIYMDIWGPINDGHNNVFILTIIDRFTRWVEADIMLDKSTETIIDTFMRIWVCRFGVPKVLVSDNETSFVSSLMEFILKSTGITHLTSTPYHPEGNALIESFHRTLKKGLHSWRSAFPQMTLQTLLQFALMGYRASPHLTLYDTPAYVTHGVDIISGLTNTNDDTIETRLQLLREIRQQIFQSSEEILRSRREKQNMNRQDTILLPGQLVLYELLSPDRGYFPPSPGTKGVKWSLPCRVIRVSSQGKTAHIRDILTGTIRQVHLQHLKLIERPNTSVQKQQWTEEITEQARNSPEYHGIRVERLDRIVNEFWINLEEDPYSLDLHAEATRRSTKKRRTLSTPINQ